MRGRTGLAVFIGIGVVVGGAGAAAADRALDKPAFAAAPAELLAAAQDGVAPEADEHARHTMLRREIDTSFDAQGRATVREHEIYVVRAPAAGAETDDDADDADDERDDGKSIVVAVSWRPSFQDRPTIRCRVIEAGGAVYELDPAKIEDATVNGSGNVSGPKSDWGMVTATLPRPPAGSVAETETVTRDREPTLGGASVWTYLSVERGATLTYSVPVGQRLRRVERKLPPEIHVRHAVVAGRERWTYDVPATVAHLDTGYEAARPYDEALGPTVGVTTAASWAAVARAYRALIDRRIADGPVALPASVPHAASREAIDAIVAWLRGRAHPGPLTFARAPYTPQPPAAVLTRGADSSTDYATLLVAVLRQAGIRAHLALIATTGGVDVDPELPGLNRFDHVLVRARLATGDVWIDPAEDLIPAGRLPHEAQGRRALVIADDTAGLVTTPAAAAGDNATHETRTFLAAEYGPSALTVVSRATGTPETVARRVFRRWTAPTPTRAGRDGLDRYGGKLVRVTPTAATDLATPFTVTHEIRDCRQVFSGGDRIEIVLPRDEALQQVPKWLKEKPEAARVHDFVWWMPHVFEIENRIELPPGFAPPPPAPDNVVHLGPATFTERGRVDGQTLIVTLRFDTGKLRWTPAELAAMQDALPKLDGSSVRIVVKRTAYALREAGKYREAAAEDARMIALHPQEALHHAQLAELWINAGLGDAARREARKAVELAPTAPAPLATLGWVLHHDRFGRDFVHDWDRAGSLEALRKARAIDPGYSNAAFELAIVLERSPTGALYARGADLQGAIEAWTAAHEKSSDPEDVALRLAEVLLWAGQPIAAETMARTVSAGTWRDELIVDAIADTQGGKAAIAEAGKLRSGDERRVLIGNAGWVEIDRRRYDLARALFAETPGSDKLSEFWTAMLPRLAVRPDAAPGSSDPHVALDELFLAMSDPARKTAVFWDPRLERGLRGDARRSMPSPVRRAGAQILFGDMMRSAGFQLEGGDGAWRAKASGKPPIGFSPYLVLDHGSVKVIGTSRLYAWPGHYVLGLDLGDAAAAERARRLLDLVRSDLDGDTAYRPTLFKRLWGNGKPTDRAAIELAAAVLAGDLETDRGVAIASRCALPSAEAHMVCHALLAYAHFGGERWAEAAKEYEAVVTADPSLLSFLVGGYARALQLAGRTADADRVVDGYLAGHPDDEFGLITRYQLAVSRGDAAEAARRLDAFARAPKPKAYQLNTAAWNQLQPGGDLVRGVELAKKAVELAKFGASERNTLAALEAELGDLGAAVRDNELAMVLNDTDEPTSGDRCVAARIAEQLGQTDDAIAIYRKIAKPGADPFSVAGYAARRLAALHAP